VPRAQFAVSAARDSIDRVTNSNTESVPVAEVPAEFSDAVVFLDIREDDEWEQGHATIPPLTLTASNPT
jgi:hypothetical protein